LKQHFSKTNYKRIIICNNLLKATPFVLFLIYKMCFLEGVLLYFLAFLISFVNKKSTVSLIVPTPFGKRPPDFIVVLEKRFGCFH